MYSSGFLIIFIQNNCIGMNCSRKIQLLVMVHYSRKGHWSKVLSGLTVCTHEKLFNVSLFLRSTTTLGLGLGLGPVTPRISDPIVPSLSGK